MLCLRNIVMRGPNVADAIVSFEPGANVLAGESDTGKSLLLHCLDYILGADEMRKRVPKTEAYAQLFVEFVNARQETLTLERSLSGGDLAAHDCSIDQIASPGRRIVARRYGKSVADDVSSVILPFSGISDAKLRKNDRGDVQRLTIRTFMPTFLVDEISVIAEQSPIMGKPGYDDTARRRMFAFMLSGRDDVGVIAAERRDIVNARLNARLGVIAELLTPLEQRLEGKVFREYEESIERTEATIKTVNADLTAAEEERATLHDERRTASDALQKAETQIAAIDQLLIRYELLDQRYASDLDRLDFVAEGAHFFDGLQEVTCPLCDQVMSADHARIAETHSTAIYEAAKVEAAKILAQRTDLAATVETLEQRRFAHVHNQQYARKELEDLEALLGSMLAPRLQRGATQLEALIARRIELESLHNDFDQVEGLRLMKEEIEQAAKAGRGPTQEWEPLPPTALRHFCAEIEAVLKEWGWKGARRVEFDQRSYDIIIDGQSRQSHGKGVRGVLYSAFVIGLLRYCSRHSRPHPGLVVIDSPLTAYKKGKVGSVGDGPIDAGIEQGFWKSLTSVNPNVQIIIIENKEPPPEVASAVHYEWFAGENAQPGERAGFIPADATGKAGASA
jgi:hypothetical protein